MSAIDCIDHIHIGDLNEQIGVYLPISEYKLSDVTEEYEDEKKTLSAFNTLFSGGGGEHLAMSIINDAAALQFLSKGYFIDSDRITADLEEYSDENVKMFFKLVGDVFDDLHKKEDLSKLWWWKFDKNQWNFNTFNIFNEIFKTFGLNKYISNEENDEESETHFEQVLMDLFGAIIIEKLPIEAFENEQVRELVVLFRDNKEKIKSYSRPNYMEYLLSLFES